MIYASEGWVKLPHAILHEPVFQDESLFHLYAWLLLRSTYKAKEILVGKQKVSLEVGELVCGVHQIVEQLGFKRTTAQRYLKKLEEWGYISISPQHNFSVVKVNSVLEWAPDEPSMGTNKKEKKDNKEKNYTRPRKRNGFFNYTDENADYSAYDTQAVLKRRKQNT